MIVVDASAVVGALLGGPARSEISGQALCAPHLIDTEVASTLRRGVLAGALDEGAALNALHALARLGITRYPAYGLYERVWALRENLTAYDATYVAVAEALDCALVTADARLARAPGARCPVKVVPG